jgi:hypothetical protein
MYLHCLLQGWLYLVPNYVKTWQIYFRCDDNIKIDLGGTEYEGLDWVQWVRREVKQFCFMNTINRLPVYLNR